MRALSLLALVAVGCGEPAPQDDDTEVVDSDPLPAFRCAVPDTFAPDERLVRWPYVTSVTTTGAAVQWGLPAGVTGRLEWGPTDDFGEVTEAEVVYVGVDPTHPQRRPVPLLPEGGN